MTRAISERQARPMWDGPFAPKVAWACAFLSLAAVSFALLGYSAGTWLSFPFGLIGAIAGGNSRRFVPMILCIVTALVLPLAITLTGF